MKKIILFLASACLALAGGNVWAQNDPLCTPFDTTGCMLDLDVAGDVFAGYRLKGIPREGYPDTLRCRYYHLDPFGTPVRQIVVTREKWANCPADLLVNAEDVALNQFNGRWSYLELGDGGYRLMAVTPKEYKELKERDMIWGEWFDYYEEKPDIEGGYPIIHIDCYPDEWQWYHGYQYSLEVMVYTDPSTGYEYMTVARNPTLKADYTQCVTGGKYNSRMIGVSREQEREWIDKSREVYPWLK